MAAEDAFGKHVVLLDSPVVGVIPTVISNSEELAAVTRKIYISTSAAGVFVMEDGSEWTVTLAVGWHDMRIKQIKATGTSLTTGQVHCLV